MTRLDDVPRTVHVPAAAAPSAIVARIRAQRPSRRTVLRGLLISAAATALVPLDWYLTRRDATAAPAAQAGDRSEYLECMPASYAEAANNWPATGPAVCYGGYRRGSFPCSDGYHREGSYQGGSEVGNEKYESTRLTTSCEGRNGWRWHGWRCSDAYTMITFADGQQYSGTTIAACALPGGQAAESAPAAEAVDPTTTTEPAATEPPTAEPATGSSGSGSSGSGSSGSGSSGSGSSGSDSSGGDSGGGDSGGDSSGSARQGPLFGVPL